MPGVVNEVVASGGFQLTPDMMAPIQSDITGNTAVLVPVGVSIMGIMISVSLIPRIIYKFL